MTTIEVEFPDILAQWGILSNQSSKVYSKLQYGISTSREVGALHSASYGLFKHSYICKGAFMPIFMEIQLHCLFVA